MPAVALTAFARLEDRTRAMLAGFQMHLAKPIEPAGAGRDGREPGGVRERLTSCARPYSPRACLTVSVRHSEPNSLLPKPGRAPAWTAASWASG